MESERTGSDVPSADAYNYAYIYAYYYAHLHRSADMIGKRRRMIETFLLLCSEFDSMEDDIILNGG